MATTAGSMTPTPSGNPQWRGCDHSIVWGFQAPVAPQTNRRTPGHRTALIVLGHADGLNRMSGIWVGISGCQEILVELITYLSRTIHPTRPPE